MELYLTINLTENLELARLQRKQERAREEEASKFGKIKGFLDHFKTQNIFERQ